MDDQQKNSGSTATLDTPIGETFDATGTIQNAGEGSSVLIFNDHNDPISTAWTNTNGDYLAKLPKGTYKVQARDLSGNPVGEAQTLSYGKDGFAPLIFGTESHTENSHDTTPHLHAPHPPETPQQPLSEDSQKVAEALSNPSVATLDIKTSTQEVRQDSRYKAVVQQLLKEQNLATAPSDNSFHEQAQKQFRAQYPAVAQFYDERIKQPKEKSDAALFEQYEKQSNQAANQTVATAYEKWLQGDHKTTFNKQKLYDDEHYRMAAQFIALTQDKAKNFTKKDKYIEAVSNYYEEQEKKRVQKVVPPAETTSSNETIINEPETISSVEQFLSQQVKPPTTIQPRIQPPENPEDWEVTQQILGNALAAEQAVQEEQALSRAELIEKAQAAGQLAEAQQAQLFQNGAIEEDNRRQEQKNQRQPRKGALDRASNTIQKARNAKKQAEQTIRVIRGIVQIVSKIPLPVLGGIAAIIVFIIFAVIIIMILNGTLSSVDEKPIREIQNFDIQITGTPTASVGETLKYDVTITYVENPQIPYENIIAQYKVPQGTEFIEGTGGSDFSPTTGIVSWKLARPENRAGFSYFIKPTQDNFIIENQIIATSTTGGLPYIPGSGIVDTSSKSLEDAFKLSSQQYKIPVAFLKAIAKKESGVLSYNQAEYDKFNVPNWFVGKLDNSPIREKNDPDIIRGYGYNTCLYVQCNPGSDVRGATQFEIQTWNSIKDQVTPLVGHDAERRYVKDVILGSGALIKSKTEQYKADYGPFNDNDWTEAQIKAMARTYCGGNPSVDVKYDRACGVTRSGVRFGYDEVVWEYYKEFKALGN